MYSPNLGQTLPNPCIGDGGKKLEPCLFHQLASPSSVFPLSQERSYPGETKEGTLDSDRLESVGVCFLISELTLREV